MMVAAIKKIVYIRNAEDYHGKILWFQGILTAAVFLLSAIDWQTALIGHMVLMLYLSFSSCQIAFNHKQINDCFFKLTKFNNAQKLMIYCASALLQNRLVIIAFAVHIFLFHGFYITTIPVIFLHILFSISFGLGISALIKNYHASFVVLITCYSLVIFKTLAWPIQELELFHYFMPYIQLLNMERFHWVSFYGMLSLSLFFMIMFIIKIDSFPKKTYIVVCLSFILIVWPIVYEQYGLHDSHTEYKTLRIQDMDVEYDNNLKIEDVIYLSEIVLEIQNSMREYGIEPKGGIRFRKSVISQNNMPDLVFWSDETFTFNVFSDILFSKNPDLIKRILNVSASYLTSRSGAATKNQSAYNMKYVMDRNIVNHVLQKRYQDTSMHIEPIKVKEYDFFENFAVFLLDHYSIEEFWKIYHSINKPYFTEESAIAVLQQSYEPYYNDYLSIME